MLHDMRKNYGLGSLSRCELMENPFEQFRKWFSDTLTANIEEPNAMCLATADSRGKPSARMVLLKHFDDGGLHFFTNYESRKAQELLTNPRACTIFFWKELERQVIIEGTVRKLSEEESFAYFSKRPRRSQIGAWTSRQDAIVPSRETLEKEYEKNEKRFEGHEIPLPPFWGGFCLIPERFEFWQGRQDRLSDRFEYTQKGNHWEIHRLSP